ncbi:MAG: flavoprotein [Burkholderiales bacterium]
MRNYGGIAAYKTPDLVRRLRDVGYNVKVVLTRSADEFVSFLTLKAVSDEQIYCHLLDPDFEVSMKHITLARWADLLN